ncbi:flagellar biosynthesis protein FlhF [Hathewaya proteolytica DSM 3090]|uniref:Flagellar biosynthesis protein FlhF n=1 Tax=Hathewaya proteolytica DSM 3090 TaxID=1121331 RepID=A0A1M6L968_9CLOT|nr:flagellar biosynthesis protein FlhF [Hathewaya proteolytica]SHJ67751.1 flagellar biosynthesis protein FlhF [Hathewaya proteolytica DSM 3090]
MLIKKYIVNSIPEGMNRIKGELGNDVIIVSQRKVRRSGLIGYFSSKQIEITVAYEKDLSSVNNAYDKYNNYDKHDNRDKVELHSNHEPVLNNQIMKDVNEMKAMISSFVSNNKTASKEEEDLSNYRDFLSQRDIPEDIIDVIVEKLNGKVNNEEEVNVSLLKDIIMDTFDVKICDEKDIKDGVTAFVGPTGVGKTTTIAKLAGKYSLEYKKKVGLITVDTYRIGAVEQLKTYAEIMGIPFEVVFDIKEMERAIEKMKDCHMIFLDTTGRSSKNLMQLQELKAFVKKAEPNKVFLVLSATTKNKDINSIIEGYKIMDYESLIITKLDETTTYGSILTMVKKSKVPVSYVTVGQGVPQDIKKIGEKELAEIVLGETSIC